MAERGVIVSRETIRLWVNRFGVHFAACIRRGRPRPNDKWHSYIKPIARQAPGADHRAHKGLNNRIEGSHRPTRRREKIMGRFKSPGQAQRFLAAHEQINTIFKPRRYRLTARSYRHARADAFSLNLAMPAELFYCEPDMKPPRFYILNHSAIHNSTP